MLFNRIIFHILIFVLCFFTKSNLLAHDVFNCNPIKDRSSLRVMTFNIHYKNFRDTGNFAWDARYPLISNMLTTFSPDIIGFQEVMPSQLEDMKKLLVKLGYKWFGVSRDKDSLLKKFDFYKILTKKLNIGSEGNYIFYNSERLNCLESGTFWLNSSGRETEPDWGAKLPRICTWGHFLDKYTQKKFFVFNTHLDHKSFEARKNGAELIANTILNKTSNRIPALMIGDFNSYGGDSDFGLISLFKEPWLFEDAKNLSLRSFTNSPTYRDLSSQNDMMILDHILVNSKDLVSIIQYAVIDRKDEKRLSDHYPIFVDLHLK